MVRYEVKTAHKSFTGNEATRQDAEAYIQGLVDAGVTILSVEYFDKASREADIRAGKV